MLSSDEGEAAEDPALTYNWTPISVRCIENIKLKFQIVAYMSLKYKYQIFNQRVAFKQWKLWLKTASSMIWVIITLIVMGFWTLF